jgi:ParB-like chromosome segregation protein Spo0J
LDYEVYPRTEVNSVHITDIVEAIKAGVEMPPIIAEKATGRVVDGFHRIKAAERLEMKEIGVEWKEYKNRGVFYLDAVRLNTSHGRKLTRYDQARIITMAEGLKIEREILANAMNITPQRIKDIRRERTALSASGQPIPIKRSIRFLAATKLNKKQEETNKHLSGWSLSFHAQEIIGRLEADLIDWDNPGEIEILRNLREIIDRRLRKVA